MPVALALVASLAACAPTRPREPESVSFVLVRHAEKAEDAGNDPALAPAGEARAQRLADSLRDTRVSAVYATQYRRTRLTAEPTARDQHLAITQYAAQQPAAEFAAQLRERHASGTTLVIGHSNTIPEIAAALCACTVAPMREDEYDRRLTVKLDGGPRAVLFEDRY